MIDWFGWAAVNGVLPFLALGVAGWWLLGRQRPVGALAGPLSAVLAVLAIAANVVWVPENPDYLGYTAGPFAVCLAGGAALVSLLAVRTVIARVIAGACVVLVMMAAVLAPPALFRRSRARDASARLLAAGALAEAPPRAILTGGVRPLGLAAAVPARGRGHPPGRGGRAAGTDQLVLVLAAPGSAAPRAGGVSD